MSDRPPDAVQRLRDERAGARAAGDYARADALRDQIRERGWEVQDRPDGTALRPALPAAPTTTGYARPEDLESLLDKPPAFQLSIQLVADDHPEDLLRCLAGIAAHPPSVPWELVLVSNQPSFDVDSTLGELRSALGGVEPAVLSTSVRLGWADAWNLGIRRSLGEITVLFDSSLELTGDIGGPLLAAFVDPTVGIAGGWGVVSSDGRHFDDAPVGEVDAVEAYCLALRRDALRAVRGFDGRFRFYRNADLDLSFAVRAAGWRAVRTAPLPIVRHEHRGWASVAPEERDRLSRRNFYRFLKHWGDRRDLLLQPHSHER